MSDEDFSDHEHDSEEAGSDDDFDPQELLIVNELKRKEAEARGEEFVQQQHIYNKVLLLSRFLVRRATIIIPSVRVTTLFDTMP